MLYDLTVRLMGRPAPDWLCLCNWRSVLISRFVWFTGWVWSGVVNCLHQAPVWWSQSGNVTLLVRLNVGIWPWCVWKRISASLCLLWFFFTTAEDLLGTDSCFKIETLLIYSAVDLALVFICTYLLLSGYVRQEKTLELSLLSKERMTNWGDCLVCVCLWENI